MKHPSRYQKRGKGKKRRDENKGPEALGEKPAVGWGVSTYPLCDLSDVLPMLPAGEHVGEGQRLQACVDQVRFGRLPLIFLCCSKPVTLDQFEQGKPVKVEVKQT